MTRGGLTTKSVEWRNAVKAAKRQNAISADHVAALFDVSTSQVNRWASLERFHAYRLRPDRVSAWCFPVMAVEAVLGFKIREVRV